MDMQLIEGEFEANDAFEIICQMIQVKIKYHEQKIGYLQEVEDIKLRETKIKKLQSELQLCRDLVGKSETTLKIKSTISIN